MGVVIGGIFWISQDWSVVYPNAFAFLAALVFVAIFTQLTVNEQKARTEVERLAQQLSEANRKLSEYAIKVEELATAQERNRLAREIHDGLGHYLTAINMQIKAAQAVLDQDAKRSLDAMSKAQTLTQEALADVRRSVAALRAGPIADRPLSKSLTDLLDEVRCNGIQADLTIQGAARPLPPQVELALYRAAQEGMTNVCKHARATLATLILDYTADDRVRLTVQDNGVGAVEADGGFGLLGLRERVQLLSGQVHIQTAPDQGFVLEIEIPTAPIQAQLKG
jgi:signal transduction histidine kinase